jgi:hypothetical protein
MVFNIKLLIDSIVRCFVVEDVESLQLALHSVIE